MERSPNQYIEPMSRSAIRRAEATRLVIAGMVQPPQPIAEELPEVPETPPVQHGWNANGDYQ